MLVLALRNVLRTAEMACRYAERPEKQSLRAALARFNSTIPGLVNARGVLEHFDEYKDINGNPSVLFEVTFERADGRYVISVGSARIDVEIVLREARHLSGNVIATAGDAWSYPVGNEVRAND